MGRAVCRAETSPEATATISLACGFDKDHLQVFGD